MKILIVDDMVDYVESLTRALRKDFDIASAHSMNEAKQKMHGNIKATLLDIRLSETDEANRDGILLLKWIKDHFPLSSVIIMSAYRDHDAAIDALNFGAAYYLKKPINLRELKDALKKIKEIEQSE